MDHLRFVLFSLGGFGLWGLGFLFLLVCVLVWGFGFWVSVCSRGLGYRVLGVFCSGFGVYGLGLVLGIPNRPFSLINLQAFVME